VDGALPDSAGIETSPKLLADLVHNEDAENYLCQCLPPRFAYEDFLNRLEPASFLRLLGAALEMSLGANWRATILKTGLKVGTKKQGN
jgi:hypothetical protein